MAATTDRPPRPVAVPVRPSPGSVRGRVRTSVGLQAAAIVAVVGVTLVALVGITLVVTPGATPAPTAQSFLVDQVRPAAAIELTGSDGKPFSLASMRGRGALVFFGYTHCPDVCPNTIGIVGQVIDRVGPSVGGVFVSIDPERDTVDSLAEYVKYIPKGFTALTGSAVQVRATADAWGVKYARVETDTPGAYSMTHTASVYLVDQQGLVRAVFPYGIQPDAMMAVVREVLATPAATVYPPTQVPAAPTTLPTTSPTEPPATALPSAVAPTAGPTPAPASPALGAVRAELVSSSVWAGGSTPVIFNVFEGDQPLADPGAQVSVHLTSPSGQTSGGSVTATAVQPPGMSAISYVAVLDIPSPGWWRLEVTVSRAGATAAPATISLAALDPGGTAQLGGQAPTERTPTLADVGGDIVQLSTDPQPDKRLYQTSTADALAAHEPFVLVVDSTKFRTSPACGKALVMARFLQDRWPSVPFIHLEPFEYTVVSDTPVLVGVLTNPTLVAAAAAWGIGPDPWGPTSMPWVFVIDGNGLVRAKYQGVIGSADIDVLLSLIEAGG